MKDDKVSATDQIAVWFAESQLDELIRFAIFEKFIDEDFTAGLTTKEAKKKRNRIAKLFILESILHEAERCNFDINDYIIRHATMKIKSRK